MVYKFIVMTTLTPTQQQFIRDNFKTMLYKDIAAKISTQDAPVTENKVQYFCYNNNLRKQVRKGRGRRYIRQPIPAPVKTGKHWPADHTNKSREDYINYYLSL